MSYHRKPGVSYTSKPCHGCGESGRREADKLCYHCQTLMNEAKSARDLLKVADNRQVFRGPENVWRGFPRIYVPGEKIVHGSEGAIHPIGELLQTKLRELYLELSDPISWDVVNARVPGKSTYELPPVFVDKYGHGLDWQGSTVLMKAESVECLRALYANITEALSCAETYGRSQGANLLSQLAAGTISSDDFNKKTVLGDANAVTRRTYSE